VKRSNNTNDMWVREMRRSFNLIDVNKEVRMSKLDDNIAELQKLAAFGQAVLDAVKESGLIKQKRRVRRQATKATPRARKQRAATKTPEQASTTPLRTPPIPRREIAQTSEEE